MLLDVVIPTYRDGAWLEHLLDSVVEQNLTRTRIFVVYDREEVPEGRAASGMMPELTVVHAPRGIGAARNAGASAGAGDWILFLDADGILPDGFLAHVRQIIMRDNPNAAAFNFYADSFKWYLRAGTRVSWWYLRFMNLFGRAALPGFATLVSRRAFTEIGGYRNDLAISEDFVLSDDLFAAGYSVSLYARPWLIYSTRRFDLPIAASARLFWRYLVIDLARRLSRRTYALGEIDYAFGAHAEPGRRRYPRDLRT
ncbi:glycosyltransferase [Solwaraspora sp. WMMD406]|uniref:glycosyltransferase n=1 Tax=Solwaraspora sp. WMMD406 TaxID=3016095 RepID=UPI00241773A8|nr:glycosyltransferase [Solwaraspora sp. WMMD406]MDG4768039.1 glycosyltransferase [Solwaraspora sp. WMMD406]